MDNKIEEICLSAHSIFLKKGYRETSISDIAKSANVSVGTIYKYFSNKEELFLEIYIKENDRVRSEMIKKLNWDEAPEILIENIFHYISIELKNNMILQEWGKSNVSNKLKAYYSSEKGKKEYKFHLFLFELYSKKIDELRVDDLEKKRLLEVYDLLSKLEFQEDLFSDNEEGKETLIRYFLKGVFGSN